jgi:hypothetical protein
MGVIVKGYQQRRILTPPVPNPTTLRKVISGGQVGADIAGVAIAKEMGFKTGGHMPTGFLTQRGKKPGYAWMYQMRDDCPDYRTRTHRNVQAADATIRLCVDFNTPGEYCTLAAIRHYKKPHLDIFMENEWYAGGGNWEKQIDPYEVAYWIVSNGIEVLNIAGNGKKWLEVPVYYYLQSVFNILLFE